MSTTKIAPSTEDPPPPATAPDTSSDNVDKLLQEVTAADSASNAGKEKQEEPQQEPVDRTHSKVSRVSIASSLRRTSTVSSVLPPQFRDIDWATRPMLIDEEGEPVPTMVEVVLVPRKLEIDIRDGKELLTFILNAVLYWTDHRLEGFPVTKDMPSDVWRPECMIPGSLKGNLDLGGAEKYEILPSFHTKDRTDGLLEMGWPITLTKDLGEDMQKMKVGWWGGASVTEMFLSIFYLS